MSSSSHWSQLVYSAEKLLGGPAPFINLTNLLSDETGVLAARARRLAANVDHPFFSSIRACLQGVSVGQLSSLQPAIAGLKPKPLISQRPPGGLLLLLLGQSAVSHHQRDVLVNTTKMCHQQRSLAELFETVHLAIAIHKGLVDLSNPEPSLLASQQTESYNVWLRNMETTNKLATLAGDVLLASVSTTLANLHNAEVVDAISAGIGDMVEAEFSQPFTGQDNDELAIFPPPPPLDSEWLKYVQLARGSLLARCCQSVMLLLRPERQQMRRFTTSLGPLAYQFGLNWACLSRLLEEVEYLKRIMAIDEGCIVHHVATSSGSCNQHINMSRGVPPVLGYTELGLSEPTLGDAILAKYVNHFGVQKAAQSMEHPVNVSQMYLLTCRRLATVLKGTTDQLLAPPSSNPSSVTGLSCCPASQLLRQMVDHLCHDVETACTTEM